MYPGFKADCSGEDKGFFEPCAITSAETTSGVPYVSAKLEHQLDPEHSNGVALMSLSLSFTDANNG